ncbi:group 1 glycosyl transferase [Paenibacillus mucilaginosus 3016]|uniref:Group 1 glycosyl transferase n=1 Tax=Paenibacillus mucilaginosus 3016 TaxID=1116391 RepID=H6NR97_9BACL|nr:glycosyltransferase [Paenibacillus mucilaginosus]AFC32790.1 group 1 glycosyl transferase [Paenibacillus mucilaginosus 3016]WFA21253.1 glycosyltransferase family 1 protein [Paenibacillus mucilaginosus]
MKTLRRPLLHQDVKRPKRTRRRKRRLRRLPAAPKTRSTVRKNSRLRQAAVKRRRVKKPGSRRSPAKPRLLRRPAVRSTEAAAVRIPYTGAPGINLIGYNRAEMGLGEGCRLLALALESCGMPYGINNFERGNPSRMGDLSWAHREQEGHPYRVNLFHVNGDNMRYVREEFGDAFMKERYNIGYWAWELSELPDSWRDGFTGLQEIWTPTTFVRDVLARHTALPVRAMPYGIRIPGTFDRAALRARFGLPPASFLFLSMFDVFSTSLRKNPSGAIEAFRRAFPSGSSGAALVVKINNAEAKPEEVEKLRTAVEGCPNILLLPERLTRQEVYGLLAACDSFVSLHRSEGFGLVLAEAMYLGKPVIATDWSGNTDFMNGENSIPVRFELQPVGQDAGPYTSAQVWAEPDLEHAADGMRRAAADLPWSTALGCRGQMTIRSRFSPEASGLAVRQRLQELSLL